MSKISAEIVAVMGADHFTITYDLRITEDGNVETYNFGTRTEAKEMLEKLMNGLATLPDDEQSPS